MTNPSQAPIESLFLRLSHELRTPITSLQGAIALLQSQQVQNKSEIESLLALAAESTERLTQTIESVLDWYQITQKDACLFKQACDITSLLNQAVDSLRPFASQKNIQIDLDIPHSLTLHADHYFLSRALSYLLRNAIQVSPPDDSVHITAHICRNDRELKTQPHLQIAIKDQGRRIPETDIEAIFQPFHQIDHSDTHRQGGLGLELAICREIVRQHQGCIWVESVQGQGTTFHIVLPLDREN